MPTLKAKLDSGAQQVRPTGGAVPKRGRPRKQVTAEDVPKTQVKKEGKVKIVPRKPGRVLGRQGKSRNLFDSEEETVQQKRRAPRRQVVEETTKTRPKQQPRRRLFDETGATVTPSNYNQTGALGAPIQIRPAFPGVQKPFTVQEYPRDYSNLSASVNPGIPQYLAAQVSPGVPSGMNFLQQPGPPQQMAPSAGLDALIKQLQESAKQQAASQFVAPQVEPYGLAQTNVPQLRQPDTTAYADVQDRAAAPPSQALGVVPQQIRQQMATQTPDARPSEVSLNPVLARIQQEADNLRNDFVQRAARVQSWNQGTIVPSSRGSVTGNSMADVIEIMGSEYRSQPPTELRTARSSFYSDSIPSTAESLFDDSVSEANTDYRSDFATLGSGLMASAGGNSGWYRGTTPTMRAAGDKRLMAQYGPQMAAQRHMEQRVDYLGYAGTGLVRTTPVYEAGDVGWAEPPKGAATINTASYRGRATVAIRDPNTLKVGQKATTGQTLAQQRLAAMYEQRVVGKPRLQMSGQPYFDNDVDPVGVTAAPARVMPNAVYSKLRGSPPAI